MSRAQRSVAWVAMVMALMVALASIGPAPRPAQAAGKKLDLAHIMPPPESGAIGYKYFADEVTKRSNGQLNVVFHGGTLLGKELEIMDAVKSGNIAFGTPVGAACTVFPEMCVFLTPYLVRDYNHAYAMFNGEIGRQLDDPFQKKYQVKLIYFYHYGPTLLVMNLDAWKGLTPEQQKLVMEVGREAQKKVRELTESVDNFAKAKEILEARGMKVNAADVASFRKIAEDKIWPPYKQQYGELWDKIVASK